MTETIQQTKTSPGTRTRKQFIVLVIVLLAAAVAWHYAPFKKSSPSTNSDVQRIAALEAKIIELEMQRDRVQQQITGLVTELSKKNTTPDTAYEARIAALESKLAAAPVAGVDTAGLTAQIDELRAQIAKNSTVLAADSGREVGLLIALDKLERAIESGEPYNELLQTLANLAGEDAKIEEALENLRALAESGVPLKEEMKASFAKSIETRLKSSEMSEKSPSFSQRMKNNLRKLVTIRKVGDSQSGDSDDAIIARAEADIVKDELSKALQEIGELSQSAAPFFFDWANDAQAYLDSRITLKALRGAIYARNESKQTPALDTPISSPAPLEPQ